MAVVLSHGCSPSPSSKSYAVNTCSLLEFPKHINFRLNKFSNFSTSSFPGNAAHQRFSPILCKIEADPDDEVDNLGVKAAISTLRFYKREISPLLPKSCRYVPTCSEYSMIAYKKYGFVKGTLLTASRICRCNPLGGSGFDPPRWFDEERVSEEEDSEEEDS